MYTKDKVFPLEKSISNKNKFIFHRKLNNETGIDLTANVKDSLGNRLMLFRLKAFRISI